ncbi:histidine phosphatase family protein [candidate division KSB1 bacterium]|nr:histidine phosphatase family protein [candidate division KSB1 bacterium]
MLKTLYLVRHARAEARSGKVDDQLRALDKLGKKKAATIAKRLKKEGVMPDLIITSPATRASETAKIFASILGYAEEKIMQDVRIYDGNSAEALLLLTQTIADSYQQVMLFGHEPGIGDLSALLLKDFNFGVPKAGVICIGSDKTNWTQFSAKCGELQFALFPMKKGRRKLMTKQLSKAFQLKLAESLEKTCKKFDPQTAEKMKKRIKKLSKQFSEDFFAVRQNDILRSAAEIAVALEKDEAQPADPVPPKNEKAPQRKSKTSTKPAVKSKDAPVSKSAATEKSAKSRKRATTTKAAKVGKEQS